MKTKLGRILLIDDDNDSNYFHQRVLKKMDCAKLIETASNGIEGLYKLKTTSPKPDIIFLDINMPKMDGWEFLKEYEKLSIEERGKVLIMVTSSMNPDDQKKAETFNCVQGFKIKYLEEQDISQILSHNFPDYI